jgi:pimeloyl-ACP methyl ester carboxylesterase
MTSESKPSRSRHVPIRGLQYHLREWGRPGARRLVMLHGWMDVSASFQFLVDALAGEWHVIAPDWRGYGETATGADSYWFPDYLADLDLLLDHASPDEPALLVGHSMGGNVALLYAGVRPARVRAVVNLEGLGLRDAAPEEAPQRYAQWIDQLRKGPRLRDYASLADVATRLQQNNARLPRARAEFLARYWSEPAEDGRYRLAADPAHLLVNPVLYRWAEVQACWARVECAVLWVQAQYGLGHGDAARCAEVERRRGVLPHAVHAVVPDAGHMLHHDQPEALARLIEEFVAHATRADHPPR